MQSLVFTAMKMENENVSLILKISEYFCLSVHFAPIGLLMGTSYTNEVRGVASCKKY